MKLLRVYICVLMLLVISVSSGSAQEEYDVYDDFANEQCSFSAQQLEAIPLVVSYFDKYAEEKIIKKYFDEPEYQDLARALTKEFVNELGEAEAYCTGEGYNWTYITTMATLESSLLSYVQMIRNLSTAKDSFPSDDSIGDEMLKVQSMLGSKLLGGMDMDAFVNQNSLLDMNVSMIMDEFSLDISLIANGEGVSNKLGTTMDTSMDIEMSLDAIVDGNTITVNGAGKADVRIVDEIVYLKMDDVTLSVDSSLLGDDDLQQVDALQDQIKLLEGKWIEIPLYEFASVQGIQGLTLLEYGTMPESMLKTPMIISYFKDGSTSYGGINPLICSYGLFGSTTECLRSVWRESYDESQGKGFVFMEENLKTMSMGITDLFTDEKMPAEMQSLNGEALITRNEQKILNVTVPLDQFGSITYVNGYLTIDLLIPDGLESISIDLRGPVGQYTSTLKGSIQTSEFDMTMDFDYEGPKEDAETAFNMAFIGKEAGMPSISVSITAETQETPIERVTVSKPDPTQTIGLESLLY